MRMATASMLLVSSSLLMLLGGRCVCTAFASNRPAVLAATAQHKPCHGGAAHQVVRPRRQVASPEAEAFSVRLAGLLATVAAALTAARRGRRPSQKPAVRAQANEHNGTAKPAMEGREVMRQKLEIAWRVSAQAPHPTASPEHAEAMDGRPRTVETSPRDVPEVPAACAGMLLLVACLASFGILLAELYKLVSTGMHVGAHHRSSVLSLALCMRLLRKDGGR
mmetsp:Transcript_83961/g.271713  ORF Transcript_83961/g.271713 Transcript_83961/m.271713 type:complete len:222 (+) Transcript_83961:98-763(+)